MVIEMKSMQCCDPQQQSKTRILAFDHVGIRVSHKQRAKDFYHALGFIETAYFPDYEANEMMSADGVRINLIFNASNTLHSKNILLDRPIKLPGITHPAFIVDDLKELQHWLNSRQITITEGPHFIGSRRIALFIRDPDGNVLEFNQIMEQSTQ